MREQPSSFDCTSADFEKAAIQRFRALVIFLPQECQVFREPWECSTVLCLDFAHCPHLLDITKEKADLLAQAAQDLGLANSMIFRVGSKFRGSTALTLPE